VHRAVRAGLLFAVLSLFLSCRVARAASQPTEDEVRAAGQQLLGWVSPLGPFRLGRTRSPDLLLELADKEGHAVGALLLRRGVEVSPHRFRSRSFAMEIANMSPAPAIVDTLVHAAWAIAERDDGAWAFVIPGRTPRLPHLEVEATVVFVVAAGLIGLLRKGRVSWEVRLPHLLPAAIQVALFAYWAVYWPIVRDHVPSLLVELLMAFAADAAFSFARFGSWRVGASPLPIVLSANLFAWFFTPGIVVFIVVAFASKALLRRGGRHVLNPSAAGLTVGGVCTAVAPGVFAFGGVFHTMNTAPNLAELVVLLALVPQLRFRILPVSIGAVLALWSTDNPTVLRPSVLLAVVLLATDPATIPRTDLGKLAFGAFVGFGIAGVSVFLRYVGVPDDFSKVMPIPVANALVPQFDAIGSGIASRVGAFWRRAAERYARGPGIEAWVRRALAGRPSALLASNGALVALWLLLVVPAFGHGKPMDFEPAIYWTWGTPLVVRDADDVPRCPANPVFCKPFSFVKEVELWRAGGAASGPTPPDGPRTTSTVDPPPPTP
jgi:hypothetical protein